MHARMKHTTCLWIFSGNVARQWVIPFVGTVPIQLSSKGDFPLRMFEHRGKLHRKVDPLFLLVT